MDNYKAIRGGEFLIKETSEKNVFIPEEFDEEQIMIAQSCKDFLEAEIYPILDRIDSQEEDLMKTLLQKAGELGLLGISVSEEYDGFGQSFVTSMLVSEVLGAGYAFSVAYSAHTGIGTLPILYYGDDEQKQKYLPKLASGELTGAYCLTEPGAGSDANSGKTKATLTEDGKHYILNGQKMWITNGGFADVQTVFAKIDNDRVLSAFIVEKNYEGVSFNPEEKKMGIKGSSTVQIFYNNCKVPVGNLLGKRGEGFRIALNILNLGRIKLGANVLGIAKRSISHSVNYANERKQFKTLISNFGAIKHKLAQQVIKTFASESAVYRASQNIEDAIKSYVEQGMIKGKANVEAQREYAPEAAILKVYGSESLDYVVDEGVQIHGGMGFSSETEIERAYRDSRINRIFEGTNEINRLVIVDTIIKKGQKGVLSIFEKAVELFDKIDSLNEKPNLSESYFEKNQQIVNNFKNACLILTKALVDKFQRKIAFEQELLFNLSNMIIETYVAESLYLRVKKLKKIKDNNAISVYTSILDVFLFDASNKIYNNNLEAIYSFVDIKEHDKYIKILRYYTHTGSINTKESRRKIANKLIDDNKYNF